MAALLNSGPDLSDGGHPPPHGERVWTVPRPQSSSTRGEKPPRARATAQPSMDNNQSLHNCANRFLRIRGSPQALAVANKRTKASASICLLFAGPRRPTELCSLKSHEFRVLCARKMSLNQCSRARKIEFESCKELKKRSDSELSKKNGGLIRPKGIFFETCWPNSSGGFVGSQTFFQEKS